MRRSKILFLLFLVSLTSLTCFAQQEYVSKFDAYAAYSFLTTPKLNLFQNGFDGEFGWNVRRWVALGGDFSVMTGSSTLTTAQLSNATMAKLAPYLPLLPPGFKLAAPYNSTTYTYSAGPQFNYRKFKAFTFFVRPALGAMHQSVSVNPGNPLVGQIVGGLIGPKMKTSDTVVFYGFGGGFDVNVSKHVGIRAASDFVHTNLFSNLLSPGENSVRFSIAPTWRFGGNVEK